MARSSSGLYSMTRCTSMPQTADTITFGRASSMRIASSFGGEPSEHDRVDGADPGAGQHGDDRLGDHRQVDDDGVALGDTEGDERAGEPRHLVPQLAIGERALHAGDGRVVDQGGLLGPAHRRRGGRGRCEQVLSSPPVNHR